jgi:hypothetical protein
MRFCLLALALTGLSGCTTWALKHSTLNLAESSMDLRYREVIENLALIYDNPDGLPAYSSIYSGAADINDTLKLSGTNVWTRSALPAGGYSKVFSGSVDLLGSRAEKGTWTLDPMIVPEKLRAMRAACRLVLFGPESVGPDWQLLKRYEPPRFGSPEPGRPGVFSQGDPPGIYFGVLDKLERIPPGWLHYGHPQCVPKTACYDGNCHGSCVWVEPDGMEGLSQFALVIQAIARVHYETLYYPRPRTRMIAKKIRIDPNNPNAFTTDGQALKATITVYVDDNGLLTPGDGLPAIPPKARTDNVGSNADLKSIISATAKSP